MRRGFTLIELLIAFAISTVLLGAIYLFYIGFVKTGSQTEKMAFLNQVVDNKLDLLTRELRSAIEVTELKPRLLRFRRYMLPRGELSAIDLETRRVESLEYKVVEQNGQHVFFRQRGLEVPEKLFEVDQCGPEVFKGYVLQLPGDDVKGGEFVVPRFPLFRDFDTVTQSSSELLRIPLIKVTLDLGSRQGDHITLLTKVFLPMVYGKLVEPDWNVE